MHDKLFQLMLERINSADKELDLSSQDLNKVAKSFHIGRDVNFSSLSLDQSQKFKEAISRVALNIRKLNLSGNSLSHLGDLYGKRTTSGMARISDADTAQIIRNVFDAISLCRNLVELSLSGCALEWFCMANGELQKIVGFTIRQLPNLRKLDISNNDHQCHRRESTDELYASIGASNIEELNLSGCTLGRWRMSWGYSDLKAGEIKALINTIFSAVRGMKKLRKLNLSNNDFSNIENAEWAFIATSLSEVNTLQCVDITRNGLITYLTKDKVPSDVILLTQKLTTKGLIHDLSCIQDLQLFRKYVDERNITEALNVVSLIPSTHPDFRTVRFEAFELSYSHARETMPSKEAFVVALPYCFDGGKFIDMDPRELKVFDAYLLSYFGETLPPNQLLSVSGRMAYIRKIKSDPQSLQLIIECSDDLNDLISTLQNKLLAVQNKKCAFLIYIADNHKWYYVGLNSDSIPTMGYVSDIKSLAKIRELLEGEKYSNIVSDHSVCEHIKRALIFSESILLNQNLEQLADSMPKDAKPLAETDVLLPKTATAEQHGGFWKTTETTTPKKSQPTSEGVKEALSQLSLEEKKELLSTLSSDIDKSSSTKKME